MVLEGVERDRLFCISILIFRNYVVVLLFLHALPSTSIGPPYRHDYLREALVKITARLRCIASLQNPCEVSAKFHNYEKWLDRFFRVRSTRVRGLFIFIFVEVK